MKLTSPICMAALLLAASNFLGISTSHLRGGKDLCEGQTRQEARRASPDSLVERVYFRILEQAH